jgi:hypothetical protein
MIHLAASNPQPEYGGQLVLRIDFESPSGRRWSAIGGGGNIAEAIAFAREAAPTGHYWRVIRVSNVYGD